MMMMMMIIIIIIVLTLTVAVTVALAIIALVFLVILHDMLYAQISEFRARDVEACCVQVIHPASFFE